MPGSSAGKSSKGLIEMKGKNMSNLIEEEIAAKVKEATKTPVENVNEELKPLIKSIEEATSSREDHYVAAELKAKADLFNERAALYGDNYMRFGHIMKQLLHVQMLDPMDPHAMNRLGIFVQIVSKITRYGENFTAGGHDDSLDDIAVYAMMLKSLDNFGKE